MHNTYIIIIIIIIVVVVVVVVIIVPPLSLAFIPLTTSRGHPLLCKTES